MALGIGSATFGVLPGVGASISSMVAYATAKNFSSTPEKIGTDHAEGTVASEAANNANVGGALIPLIIMGIPGSPNNAILLSALILYKLQPGPLLFLTDADFVWAPMAAYFVADTLMFFVMTLSVRWIARVVVINKAYLLQIIFVFCTIGVFALSNRMYDVCVLPGFGVLGFFLDRVKIPLGPFVIGFVLAKIFEVELRSSSQMSDNGFWGILDRPIAIGFLAVSIAMLAWPFVQQHRKQHQRYYKEVEG